MLRRTARPRRPPAPRSKCGARSRTGDQLSDLVRGNSLSYRTVNPMTACTYSSGDATPKKIVYGDANIVASHCYTVLAWASAVRTY